MGRLTSDARQQAEQNIRTAMDQLLRGDIPPGGRCDLKTLAAQAGVNRTGFYPKDSNPGPCQRLTEQDAIITGHTTFRQQATSRLAAQHEELQRLRGHLDRTSPELRTPALTVLHTPPKDTQL